MCQIRNLCDVTVRGTAVIESSYTELIFHMLGRTVDNNKRVLTNSVTVIIACEGFTQMKINSFIFGSRKRISDFVV